MFSDARLEGRACEMPGVHTRTLALAGRCPYPAPVWSVAKLVGGSGPPSRLAVAGHRRHVAKGGAMHTSIQDLVVLTEVPDLDGVRFLARAVVAREDELAAVLADAITAGLLGPAPHLLAAWRQRVTGGLPPSVEQRDAMAAYLLPDFREEVDSDTRLLGAVSEHLWAFLAPELDGRWGRPIHVEHDHFSVIDHGLDGLSLYDRPPPLGFRLWEAKRHTGQGSVTTVITDAGQQLDSNGATYLARISKVLQTSRDPRVQSVAARIVEVWQARGEQAAVGIAVGRTSDDQMPRRPMKGLADRFAFGDPGRYEALVIEVSNLHGFAASVREAIKSGLD